MTEYVLSIDPGKSTGIALLGYNEERVWLDGAWQFGGGVASLVWFTSSSPLPLRLLSSGVYSMGGSFKWTSPNLTVITEKFTARNTRGFSYTTDSLEPLRCEGALIALGLMPDYTVGEKRWRDPALQYLVGGASKTDKKKRQHQFLKDSGFYRTGKDVGTPDADDFRSAASHGLAYLAREMKHKPTFELLTEWVERNE